MTPTMAGDSPVQYRERLSSSLGIELFLKRDDLLPFPLAGNKFRKLSREIPCQVPADTVYITNGGIASNHCRTLALLAAERGARTHLVLHGSADEGSLGLTLLHMAGADYDIVPATDIRATIEQRSEQYRSRGYQVSVIPGGCHTPAGAHAYREATERTLPQVDPDFVFVASGTGATQGGIVAGARAIRSRSQVVGISVARTASRGTSAVHEAAQWAGYDGDASTIRFLDDYTDGGYGKTSLETKATVEWAWQHGLPLDTTYTGKAFHGLLDHIRKGRIPKRSRVLFWHTGGLWNAIMGDR